MADKGMSTTTKVIIWVGVLATVGVTGVIAMRLWQRRKDRLAQEKLTGEKVEHLGIVDSIVGNTPTTCKHCVKDATFPLQKGSQGKQVAAVQYAYNLKFPDKSIIVDGDWGSVTEKAFNRLGISSLSFEGWSNGDAKGETRDSMLSIPKTIYDKYFKLLETK